MTSLIVDTDGAVSISLPWQMIFYLTTGLIAGIVVSLFTRRTDAEKIERFYTLLRTPILEDEANPSEPCLIPVNSSPLPRRVFFPTSELEIPIPTKRSITGFAIGWICVISIILFVYWISL